MALDSVLAGIGASYYQARVKACHLHLMPFVTARSWGKLGVRRRAVLLEATGDMLGQLLRDSSVRIVIINGRGAVDLFQRIAGISLRRQRQEGWDRYRMGMVHARGLAFWGIVDKVSGLDLGNEVLAVGFNYNLQTSIGVHGDITGKIAGWIVDACSVSR